MSANAFPAPEVPSPSVRPGWYPDQSAQCQRYWDGYRWTGQIAPLAMSPATPFASGPTASTGDWVVGVLLSLLIPFVGFIVGIVFIAKGGEKRNVGLVALFLSLLAFFMWFAIWGSGSSTGYEYSY